MISHLLILRKARILLINFLSDKIKIDELSEDLSQLKITLKSGLILYIRYNVFGEYGYQIIFFSAKG